MLTGVCNKNIFKGTFTIDAKLGYTVIIATLQIYYLYVLYSTHQLIAIAMAAY